jgi:agmatinase
VHDLPVIPAHSAATKYCAVVVKTSALFFPFDLFGGSGTRAGAELLADAVQEMLADNRRERVPTRARAYAGKVRFSELLLDTLDDYSDWRGRARQAVRETFRRGDFLLWTTGNHLGALPLYDELSGEAGETLVLQFDAHLDVYNLSDCTNELSHGNFLLHCAGPLPRIVNIGHRELLLRPDYIRKYYCRAFAAPDVISAPDAVLEQVASVCHEAKRIVIDLDCDVFDPAYFPAVAEPQPFGLSPQFFVRFLDAVWSEKVIGLALSEFDPARDMRDRSLATLLWLVEYVLLKRHEKR